jgi:hypothetical protein
VAKRRLANSRLSSADLRAPEDVVRRHGAVQAQDYGPAKYSIGQRASGLADHDVEAAVTTGAIIRTHVLRPTWHFVAREDIRMLLALTGPRVYQTNRSRLHQLGLDNKTLGRSEKLLVSALEGGKRLVRDEIGDVLRRGKLDPEGQRLPYIIMHNELQAIIASGGYAGKKHTYALLDERVPSGGRFDRDEALVELTRRYLTGHGPASIGDFRWWSSLTVKDIKHALDMLGDEVTSDTVEGITLWSLSIDPNAVERPKGGHLLQPFDEVIVGYTESRFLGDPRAADARAAWQAGNPYIGVVLVNGKIAGRWRRTIQKDVVRVETVTYDEPKPAVVNAIEKATADLGRFFGLNPTVEVSQL